MVYTSYYAQMRNFPSTGFKAISISRGVPQFYRGERLLELAPPSYVLSYYKNNIDKCNTEKEKSALESWYDREYVKHLENIGIDKIKELLEIKGEIGEDIWKSMDTNLVLLCYEKSADFCHRNLLSNFLRNYLKVECREISKEELLYYKDLKNKLEKEIELDYGEFN